MLLVVVAGAGETAVVEGPIDALVVAAGRTSPQATSNREMPSRVARGFMRIRRY
jgi:hypothetical protein